MTQSWDSADEVVNMLIYREQIEEMQKNPRANFVNALAGPRSAYLVGTQDLKGQTNLSVVSSCTHLGSDPALLAMIIRPRAVARHTLENILETKAWTFNNVTEVICKQAHQTSARYPKEVSEFEATGLTAGYHGDFVAPFVKESTLSIGMQWVQHVPLAINNTEMLIGRVEWVRITHDDCLNSEFGVLDLERLGSLAVIGLDHYHHIKKLYRLSYAKPDRAPARLD
jgi:flavin reductase (DIM6/NTAB) family NADH-FMN oxidoreductase RutF